jgi:hypothetical protein
MFPQLRNFLETDFDISDTLVVIVAFTVALLLDNYSLIVINGTVNFP